MRFVLQACFVICSAILSGCGNGTSGGVKGETFDLHKLAGRWQFENNKTLQFEEWKFVGKNELNGRGFLAESGDTTVIETLTIREDQGVLTYYAKVAAEVVPFKLSSQSDERIEFANPTQDFPKKIGYEYRSDSLIIAYIEGPREGNNIRITYDFKKQ